MMLRLGRKVVDKIGFIVHSYAQTRESRTCLYFIGRLEDDSTFAAVLDRYRPFFYLRESDLHSVRDIGELHSAGWEETGMRTMDGEDCRRVLWSTLEKKNRAAEELRKRGIRTYEADLRPGDQYRLDRRIHGSVRIQGEARPGRLVDHVFINPELAPADWFPSLRLLSLDIETDPEHLEILAISLSCSSTGSAESPAGYPGANGREESGPIPEGETVFFRGPELNQAGIECFPDERSLLLAFRDRLKELDPDIITGWNVVDFDFRILASRFQHHGLELSLGRSEDPGGFLPQSRIGRSRMIIPGRQVWDALLLARASPERYPDYSLETVASSVLGYGKLLAIASGESRLRAIVDLYCNQPLEFCRYCLRDARLAAQILERTGLFELSLRRCLLLGVAPDRVWTSIPAFEHLYIEAMHSRGVVAPTPGVDALPLEATPGGAILEPHTGIYDRVMVFDFQSLYPSIIRTFNIDPLSHLSRHLAGLPEAEEDLIRAPNGARFRRERSILPELLDRFFHEREAAKQRGDPIASFVYKIIMNSFYGVLGSPGCRFAGSELAGAVTGFGQELIAWCKGFLERQGRQVIYGDTDSLFVLAEGQGGGEGEPPGSEGEEICAMVNQVLEEHLARRYGVRSRLKLEYEKLYLRFFLPPLRTGSSAGKGRAKGYGGLLPPRGSGEEGIRDRIEIRGMEAIRRDWTDLAHEFQIGLLELLFRRRPLAEIRDFIRKTVEELRAGRLDEKLIYRKALRKPLSDYTSSLPPHVRAAAQLDPDERKGLIRYLITTSGPQPYQRRTAPPDYDHYVEKQLKPIASGFTEVLGVDLEQLFGADRQLRLF